MAHSQDLKPNLYTTLAQDSSQTRQGEQFVIDLVPLKRRLTLGFLLFEAHRNPDIGIKYVGIVRRFLHIVRLGDEAVGDRAQ